MSPDGDLAVLMADPTLLFVSGPNHAGELGVGDHVARTALTALHVLGAPAFLAVTFGGAHMGLLTSNGSILMCGCGSRGQLALGDTNERNVPVATAVPSGARVAVLSLGGQHSAAVSGLGRETCGLRGRLFKRGSYTLVFSYAS